MIREVCRGIVNWCYHMSQSMKYLLSLERSYNEDGESRDAYVDIRVLYVDINV